MTRTEMLAICLVGAVATLLMVAAMWYFTDYLAAGQRSLMFLLGLSINVSAVVFIVWKTGLFEEDHATQAGSTDTN